MAEAPFRPRPRKRLGQNFLRDRSVLPKILAAGGIGPEDTVVEVGPGTGALTEALAAAARRVIAIELDDALVVELRRRYAGSPRVEIVHADALAVDPCTLVSGPYKVAANIPYYITGPLLRHFLEAHCQPQVMVLMVQLEVARRMAAAPGDLSLLGVSVQYYARVDIVARVPAGAFWPRPKVDSAVVRLVPYRHAAQDELQEAFFRVARAGFGTRRKQLANSLMHGLELNRAGVEGLLATADIDPRRRAEDLSVAEWERLASAWRGGEV